MTTHREIVLFPNNEQFDEKTDELLIDYDYEDEECEVTTECYWTIPTYPKNRDELIGSKIYFYDRWKNCISLRATVTGFGEILDDGREKKTVLFRLKPDDLEFRFDFESRQIPKRTQLRGWAYRWWDA